LPTLRFHGRPDAHWKLHVQERGLRSGCRTRRHRALPLRHLPQGARLGVLDGDQRPAESLSLDHRGENLLRGFESSPGKQRYFCTQCGSHIVAERAGTGNILLRMGCLDTPITNRPVAHIWRSDCATWFDPKDQLPEWPEKAPKG
jgi:hypothetical protein